jgi:AcrR family transcriptional regulator
MRTRGWAGDPPASDSEAVARILAAGIVCVDEFGEEADLGKVADHLGITRQTLYRYFPTSRALFEAVAAEAAGGFVQQLGEHLRPVTSAEDAVVETIVFCLRVLPGDPRLSFIVRPANALFSVAGLPQMAESVLEHLPVDLSNLDEVQRADLAELMVRLLQGLVIDPETTNRDDAELRRFLHVCLDPAVHPGTVRS